MADIAIIIVLSVLGLVAHGARRHSWMEWTLRGIVGFSCVSELYTVFTGSVTTSSWAQGITLVMGILSGAILFKPVRQGFSKLFSAVEFVIGGGLLLAVRKKLNLKEQFQAQQIFVAESIPHFNGLWIYITTLGFLLASIDLSSFQAPMIGIPFPVPIESLFQYNLLGLIILSMCGVGIFVTRKPKEVLDRLGLVKPLPSHYGIAALALVGTFAYDYVWSFYTGTAQSGVGSKLGQYNAGTFAAGGAGDAGILALATAVCAGIGEETLMRGALQAVFGAFPAGLLHGILHGQFNHMPLLMIQIAIWSTMLGVVRKYTNTTTTIMVHSSYNLINTFLFAFNP